MLFIIKLYAPFDIFEYFNLLPFLKVTWAISTVPSGTYFIFLLMSFTLKAILWATKEKGSCEMNLVLLQRIVFIFLNNLCVLVEKLTQLKLYPCSFCGSSFVYGSFKSFFCNLFIALLEMLKAVVQRCSVKKLF